MEFTPPLSNLRTELCIVLTGFSPGMDRDAVWTPGAEEFLRRVSKLGLQITIIGPRPPKRFGSKKSLRLMDRHEVIGMKMLEASRSHRHELRVLSMKNKAWTRLRAEAIVTFGLDGVWNSSFEGWTMPGTITINALARFVTDHKWLPGHEFVFLGSTNQALRWACQLLDRGAKNCYVVESGEQLRCWRAHRDRFVSKGGRILQKNRLQRVERVASNALAVYLDNDQGTLILNADTLVQVPVNDDMLNGPADWRNGLFYVQRRMSPWETVVDEERWLEQLDWRELSWRVARYFDRVDHAEADGALKTIKSDRRKMLEYRKPDRRRDLGYSGKILDRDTTSRVQTSVSVPRTFAHPKPKASLECFENVACQACADACPENAIELVRLIEQPKLLEDKCTGCGACVAVCPAGAAVMVRELPTQQKARYFLPDDSKELWREGRLMQLANRKGESVGTGRVVATHSSESGAHRILEIESTNVHLWDARQFRTARGEFYSAEAEAESPHSPTLLRRGWVTLNGAKRLCPIDVPLTVALWQLGLRRFEDAQFCHDGGCRLCEVQIDGKPQLACRSVVREGQQISFESPAENLLRKPLCYCKQIAPQDFDELLKEGVPEKLACELTGLGRGTCHGRWCHSSQSGEDEPALPGEKLRPAFHGYETSPWRDIWAADVSETERGDLDEGADDDA